MRLSPSQQRRERWIVCASVAIGGVALTGLSFAMPPQGFYSGDSGVKLIAARNAIDHPSRPFEISLPTIDGRAVPYVDRFFEVHDGHAHALQSPLFPFLSSFSIAAAGLRGVYLLPLVSFLVLLPLVDIVRRRSDPHVSVGLLAVLALLTSPVFFYGLEFWEHAPAIACVAASTALVSAGFNGTTVSQRSTALAGVASGVAILLRPEALWYTAALAWTLRPQRGLFSFALGVAAVLAPFGVANYSHSGSVGGPHISANLAPLWDHWFAARRQRIWLWLFAWTPIGFAGLALAAAAWIGPLAATDLRRRQTLALLGSATVAVAAARGAFARESLWSAWPAASLLFVPFSGTNGMRRLWFLALFPLVAIWLTSTHDGGAQWGPRFLLIAAPPLIVLSTAAAADAVKSGYRQRLRQAMVILILLAGAWTTRAAYRELRGTKRYYARIVSTTESLTEPHGYLVADVWWFDQAVAALYNTRTFLFAPDVPGASAVLQQLAAAGVSKVTLVWSHDGIDGQPLDDAVLGTCYRITDVRDIPESNLTFASAACPPRQ
jgi:hypothetical protein